MRQISEKAKKVVAGWVAILQDGDVIRMHNGIITLSNCGCEYDSVSAYAK